MFDKEFDDIIKGKLDNYRDYGEVKGWDVLSEKMQLDQELSSVEEDLQFDQKITDSLQDFKIPFEVSHWAILAERLEIEHALRMRIFAIKSLEVLILALIIFTYWNVQRFGSTQDTNITKSNTVIAQSFDAPTIEVKTTESNFLHSDIETKSNSTSKRNDEMLPSNEIVKSNSISEQSISSKSKNARMNDFNPSKDILHTKDIVKNTLAFAELKKSTLDSKEVDSVNPIASLSTENQNLSYQRKQITFQGSIIPVHRQNSYKSKWWVKAFVQGDQNFVYSSYDRFYEIAGYETTATGLSGGLLFNKEFANTEFETGLIYSTKSYVPEIINEVYTRSNGFYQISLKQIFFNVVSIPVNLNVKVFDREQFGLYTSIGASANVVINSNFLIEDRSLPAPTSPALSESNAVLDDKPFERGFLEGGSLSNNSYLTMNFGLGAKYNLTEKVGLFGQIGYNYNIFNFGVGPNEDKINNLSVGFGSRVRI